MRKSMGIMLLVLILIGSGVWYMTRNTKDDTVKEKAPTDDQKTVIEVTPTASRSQLEDGLSVLRYDGETGFQEFLNQGGASTDDEVVGYLMDHVLDVSGLQILNGMFGCSTIQTRNTKQEVLFGRNFDWEHSNALILESRPEDAYASISTVNLDVIQSGVSISMDRLPDDVIAKVASYAPLDGMNEKGLAISVNMIQDGDVIEQNEKSQDITTTTAIRLILNKAANVEEAVALLQEYDLHSSMGMMIHFAIADSQGHSVAVEYMDNEMKVVATPVLTNFYVSEGEKQGIGTTQSHERYEILMKLLEEQDSMEMNQVRDALDRVSKDNFNEFESTEWSVVYNLEQKEIHYYHRENYDSRYVFHLEEESQ